MLFAPLKVARSFLRANKVDNMFYHKALHKQTMKSKRYRARSTIRPDAGTIFNETLAAVRPRLLTNKTPIARHAGKVLLACDHCGLQFWRKSSHVGNRNFCGAGCSSAAQLRRVLCICTICGKNYLVRLCNAKNGRTTCGVAACVLARQQIVAVYRKRGEHQTFSAKP